MLLGDLNQFFQNSMDVLMGGGNFMVFIPITYISKPSLHFSILYRIFVPSVNISCVSEPNNLFLVINVITYFFTNINIIGLYCDIIHTFIIQ